LEDLTVQGLEKIAFESFKEFEMDQFEKHKRVNPNKYHALKYILNCLYYLPIVIMVGCASVSARKNMLAFNDLFSSGNYQNAADCMLEQKEKYKSNKTCLLETLQAAAALRSLKNYQKSNELFDECEEIMKYYNEESMISNVSSNVASVLINDSILSYRGEEYDGIMANTYKALNFWAIGKIDLARVEFNRALDRQRRAKERFAAEITKLKEEIDRRQAEEYEKARQNNNNIPPLEIKKAISNPALHRIVNEKYSNLSEFKVYPDFVNPFTSYIAGLFFMSQRDFAKATTLLKETYGMTENNSVVGDDFTKVEKILDGSGSQENCIWIVFENGLGPVKEEMRVDLPLLLFSNNVMYTGIALPQIRERDQAYSHLTIKSSGMQEVRTEALASMDRVVHTEFKKDFPCTLTKAVLSALIKTYAQFQAGQKYGTLGTLVLGTYQVATTSADLRIWTALPKEFQLAKIKYPDVGSVTVATPDGNNFVVNVPANRSSIIYVKVPQRGAKIIYDVFSL
jgi:hypothetical protein